MNAINVFLLLIRIQTVNNDVSKFVGLRYTSLPCV